MQSVVLILVAVRTVTTRFKRLLKDKTKEINIGRRLRCWHWEHKATKTRTRQHFPKSGISVWQENIAFLSKIIGVNSAP